jgi:hypothetical protein
MPTDKIGIDTVLVGDSTELAYRLLSARGHEPSSHQAVVAADDDRDV